jgi:type IV secretion system protein VirD4
MRPEEIRQLPDRHALIVAENGRPIIARLNRCIDGKRGRRLLRDRDRARDELTATRHTESTPAARTADAVAEARRRGLAPEGSDPWP